MAFSNVLLLQLLLAFHCIISAEGAHFFETGSCRGTDDESLQMTADCVVQQNLTGTEGQVFVLDVRDSALAPCRASLGLPG